MLIADVDVPLPSTTTERACAGMAVAPSCVRSPAAESPSMTSLVSVVE